MVFTTKPIPMLHTLASSVTSNKYKQTTALRLYQLADDINRMYHQENICTVS